jgi:hypothetical protein
MHPDVSKQATGGQPILCVWNREVQGYNVMKRMSERAACLDWSHEPLQFTMSLVERPP